MRIDQRQDPGYETAKICYAGFVDPHAVEGLLVLRSGDGREFHVRAFSGEVARHIAGFAGGGPEPVPTIYKMVGEICEENGLVLVKVKVYGSGEALRANLYLTGKKDVVLRNYRASDAMALAAFYGVPILVRETLLKDPAGA